MVTSSKQRKRFSVIFFLADLKIQKMFKEKAQNPALEWKCFVTGSLAELNDHFHSDESFEFSEMCQTTKHSIVLNYDILPVIYSVCIHLQTKLCLLHKLLLYGSRIDYNTHT